MSTTTPDGTHHRVTKHPLKWVQHISKLAVEIKKSTFANSWYEWNSLVRAAQLLSSQPERLCPKSVLLFYVSGLSWKRMSSDWKPWNMGRRMPESVWTS